MSEPTNTKSREAVAVNDGKIDLSKKPWGWTGKADSLAAPKSGIQAMDLGKVDNENEDNYNEYSLERKKGSYMNTDFGKLHDDFSLIKDAKKKPGAGK